MDDQEQKHYISREEFERATAHTRKFLYNNLNTDAKHYYASNDGRYFFIDDEGHKFYVDKATYDKAKAEQVSHGEPSRRYYHQEGGRYYAIDESGNKK